MNRIFVCRNYENMKLFLNLTINGTETFSIYFENLTIKSNTLQAKLLVL